MPPFGKHTLQNFKPYEIVTENRDPILGINSPDAPAGFSRIQRRKWKLWINALTGAMFSRKSKYENEWVLIPAGSCPETIVNYDNHNFIGRTEEVIGAQQITGRDYTNISQPPQFPVSLGMYISDNVFTGYVNTINATDINDLISQVSANITDFQVNYSGDTSMTFNVVEHGTGFYITSTNPSYNGGMQINLRDGTSGFWYNEVQDNEGDGIDGRLMYPFTIGTNIPAGPCEQIDITPETYNPVTDRALFLKPKITGTLNGTYVGHSYPESAAWNANVPMFIPGNYEVQNAQVETDGLVAVAPGTPAAYYSTFDSLIDVLNANIATTGSSFRYKAVGNDRLLITDISGNILESGDPYFAANLFVFIAPVLYNIDIFDFIIKQEKSENISIVNTTYIIQPSGLYHGTISGGLSTYLPTPQIRYLKNDPSSDGILFEAYFNQADRWILDYEPEIYLYFIKGGGGWKNHTNRATRKRIAHMAQTNTLGEPISFKLDVNPRLKSESARVNEHITEWVVDGTKPDMATVFTVLPFQFLGRPTYGSNGSGAFPIDPNIWNAINTGSEYPPTLSSRSAGDQDIAPNRDTTITMCFKLVIRNPQNPTGFPIESDISEIFKIRPNILFGSTDYNNRQVKVNR